MSRGIHTRQSVYCIYVWSSPPGYGALYHVKHRTVLDVALHAGPPRLCIRPEIGAGSLPHLFEKKVKQGRSSCQYNELDGTRTQ